MQERLNALGRESTKPLALIFVGSVGLKHGKPLMASRAGRVIHLPESAAQIASAVPSPPSAIGSGIVSASG